MEQEQDCFIIFHLSTHDQVPPAPALAGLSIAAGLNPSSPITHHDWSATEMA